MKIKKLLIANRGEIACRIIRTARQLGIKTVAVYSEADKHAMHVRSADEALPIGKPTPSESYLNIEKIIRAARDSSADAIHPGYGFLSENAEFSRACGLADIIFIGPSPEAIELMGDKAKAKRAMIKAGVPCIPGYQGEEQDNLTLSKAASEIGYPLMIKAAAGGGGRGMRLVDKDDNFEAALDSARSESINAFGSDTLILEKAVLRPRHVEIQIFGDSHGNIIYLGERDCSVQRRHQKVIEEAPCPIMTPELRKAMGESAVAAAKAVNYEGAGTVEFLLAEDMNFYFLEMNTRLQVEHPVTELVTNKDLVELQFRVAEGLPLGLPQEEVELDGHAIEIRLYAEDPSTDFLPSTGDIELWVEPQGDNVRVDKGVASGDSVSTYYDPMIAKVIAYGADREIARRRLVRALQNSMIIGLQTNRDFLIDALERSDFIDGQATTAFIGDEYGETGFESPPQDEDICLAALAHFLSDNQESQSASLGINEELLNWATADLLESIYIYELKGKDRTVIVRPLDKSSYDVSLDGKHAALARVTACDSESMCLYLDDRYHMVYFHTTATTRSITVATPTRQFILTDISRSSAASITDGDGTVRAPMHGQLLDILVSEHDLVTVGDRLAVLEAMKMQHEILADVSGKINHIAATAGSQVRMDEVIMEIEKDKNE